MSDKQQDYERRFGEGMIGVKIKPQNNNYGDALYRLKPGQRGHILFTIHPEVEQRLGAPYSLEVCVVATQDGYFLSLDTKIGDGTPLRTELTGSLELSLGKEGLKDCIVRRDQDKRTDSPLRHNVFEEVKKNG